MVASDCRPRCAVSRSGPKLDCAADSVSPEHAQEPKWRWLLAWLASGTPAPAWRSLGGGRLPAPEPTPAGLQLHDLRSKLEHFALKLVGELFFALTEALGVLRNRPLLT